VFIRFVGKLNPSVYAIAGSAKELLLDPAAPRTLAFLGCPDGDWFVAAAPDVQPEDLNLVQD